ncbi:PREDICTED: F-box protein CPR30-like isoform X1 [Fragaria vesca subsp. vesca]|uniref:F-box protein CPR30-like isoform X1 n=1 Tax=Fragaria vesca subsp. vesca TaxID=101020 RepID=UPI0002C30C52|nr:PREDICTED: F-box protein CPR30-like isoform X1 [Fragaria vesca subsp. vesca]
MAETDLLPEEVMLSILCLLPVKFLIRFTSVSKRWRFIILSDPQLATSQLNRARQLKALGPRLIFLTNAPQLESLDLADTASFGHPSSVRKLSLPFERHARRDVTILGSCNGLVCVAFDASYFYIWNPATRFFMELPEPGFPDVCQQLTFHGVGYLSATDDYRVFATSYGAYPDEYGYSYEEAEEMKMFSSRSRVWKAIRHPAGHDTRSSNQGTLLNERLHWFSWWRMMDPLILAFDLATEEFTTMRLPEQFKPEELPNGIIFIVDFCCLGITDGCLCACDYLRADSVDFWVMREYGVDDSWTKLFNFSSDGPGRCGDWLIMESCTVAVKSPYWSLVKIDHKQEEEVGMYMLQGNKCCLSMTPYQETLLRIND